MLAFASSRAAGRPLGGRERAGVMLSIVGLAALGGSLAGGSAHGADGSTTAIVLWLAGTAAAAVVVLAAGRRVLGVAVAHGLAGGLLFALGDVATKVATQGGARIGFAVALALGYLAGSALIQVGYQAGRALTVAGLATLATNAVPIAAGSIVLHEPVPAGGLGVLRIGAFAAVTGGGFLLARQPATAGTPCTMQKPWPPELGSADHVPGPESEQA